ncbi:MAG TPA: hypothetical protein VLQ68_12555 [Rhizobiaceae bacterium]|nr:hypothetical protein [Rhizobiaceae bacterium]
MFQQVRAYHERQRHDAHVLLMIMLAVDVALILAHAFQAELPFFRESLFDIEGQFGLPALMNFAQFAAMIFFLSEIKYNRRDRAFDFWKYLFLYILADDIFEISERAGRILGELFSFETLFGLTTADYGKFAFAIGGGLAVSAFLGYLLRRSSREFVSASFAIFVLLSCFAFFAVVFDVIHAVFDKDPRLGFAFAILEEGGEMIVLSFMTAYLFYLWQVSRTRPG